MHCPSCQASLAANTTRCPFCNTEISHTERHKMLGMLSLALAISAIVCFVLMYLSAIIIINLGIVGYFHIISFFSLLVYLISLVAIILGAVAFFGKAKHKYGLIALIIGICLFIVTPFAHIMF